jgi:hypothetical protein
MVGRGFVHDSHPDWVEAASDDELEAIMIRDWSTGSTAPPPGGADRRDRHVEPGHRPRGARGLHKAGRGLTGRW